MMVQKYKSAFLVFLVVLITTGVFAQVTAPFNNIQVRQMAPLTFNYSDVTQLLLTRTIENALELSINLKQEDVQVMAQVQFSGNNHLFNNLLGLQLVNKTSPNAQVLAGPIPLSAQPAQLFVQPRLEKGTKDFYFYYSVFLKPSEVIIPPGNHNFSILFTVTNQ